MDKQKIIDISTEVLSILKKYQLIETLPTETEIAEIVNHWQNYDFIHPLEILTTQSLSPFFLVEFDDCNIYQDEGFYREHLTNLAYASRGKINISDIVETWSGLDVKISFRVNGCFREIEFSVDERLDFVPAAFFEEQKKIALTETGGWVFVAGHYDEIGTHLYHVPIAVANELSDLKSKYTKKP
ncbi:hypothetical protein [Gynuella sp.]|uniref:hypothetical protein n=1 Tax=Gynuella sp. TaxID=2969146 RepID=UPI003D0EA394